MTAQTEAQAAMLTAVASHLTNYPHLPPVNIMSEDSLHIRNTNHPGRDLAEWAATLEKVPHVDVHAIYSDDHDVFRAFCYVVGYLGDLRLSAWDVVPDLLDALGGLDVLNTHQRGAITVDALWTFAEDGTPPVPLGDLVPA